MKATNSLAVIVAAGSMLITTTTLRASSEADKSINNEIFDLIMANDALAPGSVRFAVQDGVVTISGDRPTIGNKAQTDNVIAKLPGVLRVDDNRPTSADDISLTDEVKSSLMFHNSTGTTTTQVATTNGVVTITGIAKSETEKNRTTQLAAEVKGVTSVNNNMTIVAPVASN
jgi:osmotically-inducible protein OsmY